jgi:two-component system cell cycle response regulator
VKVLVAEDDPITSHLLQVLITKAGYESVVVGDGTQVLEALDQPDGPRLLLLDWMMPHMDGLQVCRTLRSKKSGPYVYLIFLTSKGKQEDIVRGLEAGADDYVTKPFDFHELMARLRTGKRILELQDQLVAQATRDSLTGLLNREAILDVLQKECRRAFRSKSPLAVIMADVDRFKNVNDTHGHLAGDAVLREAARRMFTSLRSYDSVGRYGGEEFLVIVPGCNAAEAAHLADRLRGNIGDTAIEASGSRLDITLSFGVADTNAGQAPDEILRAADSALYAAKKAGRNRVEKSPEVETAAK